MQRRGWQLAAMFLVALLVGLGWWLQRSQPRPASIGPHLQNSPDAATLEAGDSKSLDMRLSQAGLDAAPPAAPVATDAQASAAQQGSGLVLAQRGGLNEEDPSYPSHGMERDGKREGPWRTYDENGVLQSEVYYESGLREGPFTQWFDDGKLMCRGTFSKDRETGSYESFHASGAPFSTGQMLRGKQHGLWVHQAEDGRIVSELTYVNGVLEGPCSYYTNGVLDTARSGIYSKGKKTGQ